MAFRGPFAAGLLGLGIAAASLGALGASGCGGTSVEHVSDGGTGGSGGGTGGTGGTGASGTGGATVAPCTTVASFAGPEYVDWNVSPDMSCAGMEVFCYDPLDTCVDAGVPEPGAPAMKLPAPPPADCPNVRILCSTQIGCCEDIYTIVAGPTFNPDPDTSPCCYLARPGSHPR